MLTETSEVVLNAVEIEIDEATAESADEAGTGGVPLVAKVAVDDEAERATLTFDRPLPAGEATLHLRFRGVLNDKLAASTGRRSPTTTGVERVLAATQMEATDARRAFPCWDEPDAKAVFGVTLVVPDDLLAISNAAELERTPVGRTAGGGGRWPSASPTPCRCRPTWSRSWSGRWSPPTRSTSTASRCGSSARSARSTSPPSPSRSARSPCATSADWFGIVYPGDKLDLVAIPDFAFGAMENLGCVTFRERYVLVDPATATQAELQAVVDVIAHEIAHMWFGDLVTMKWWNGIWLNEAFATFMEMTCTDAFRPDWQRWVDFGLSRSAAFDTDALAATRPIEYPVVSPADADGMFDVLTYEKGASVVRMLEQYLGADRFRAGIRRYMARHQYGNTETSDLWDALEAETGEPVPAHRRELDLPGRLPRGQRRGGAGDGADAAAWRSAASATTADDADRAAADRPWSVPVAVESGGDAVATVDAPAARRRRRCEIERADGERRGSTPTPARTASTGCATPSRLLDAPASVTSAT